MIYLIILVMRLRRLLAGLISGSVNICPILEQASFLIRLQAGLTVSMGMVIGVTLSSFQRPVLVLLDRSIDTSIILHHTWTYQALIHDLLHLQVDSVFFYCCY